MWRLFDELCDDIVENFVIDYSNIDDGGLAHSEMGRTEYASAGNTTGSISIRLRIEQHTSRIPKNLGFDFFFQIQRILFEKKNSPDQKSRFGFIERNAKSALRSKNPFWRMFLFIQFCLFYSHFLTL